MAPLTRKELARLDEDALRKDVLVPLFNAMGFKDVRVTHGGSLEQGKDIVMWKPDPPLRARVNYAVVAKAERITGQARGKGSAANVFFQVEQCFGATYQDPATLEPIHVDTVIVVTSSTLKKEAQKSLESTLGQRKRVDYVDGEKLWELIEQYLPADAALEHLQRAATTLNDLSPHYRAVARTGPDGITFSLEPKHPKAGEEQPVQFHVSFAFPDTDEGKTLHEAMVRFRETGEPVEIPARFVRDFQAPDFLRPIIGKNAPSIVLGPAATGHRLTVDLEATPEGASAPAVTIQHVEFKSLRGGSQEILFSNEDQGTPWVFRLALRPKGASQFWVTMSPKGANVREQLLTLKLNQALASGAKLAFKGSRTGLMYFSGRVPGVPDAAPPEGLISLLEALVRIQDRIHKPLSVPEGDITRDEAETILAVDAKMASGTLPLKLQDVNVTIDREGAARTLTIQDTGSHVLTFRGTEQARILGVDIDLGPVEYIATGMALTESEREVIRAQLADPENHWIKVTFVPSDTTLLTARYPRWCGDSGAASAG